MAMIGTRYKRVPKVRAPPHIAMGLWNSGAKWAAVAIPSTNSAPALTGSCNFAQLGRFYPVAMMRRMSAICAFETFGPTSRIEVKRTLWIAAVEVPTWGEAGLSDSAIRLLMSQPSRGAGGASQSYRS